MRRLVPGRGVAAGLSTVLAIGAGVLTNVATSGWTWPTAVGLAAFSGGLAVLEVWRATRADRVVVESAPDAVRIRRGSLDPPIGSRPLAVRGRAEILAVLDDVRRVPDGRMHVLGGLGGCGKTTVALEVARRALLADVQVWWLTITDQQTLAQDLLDLSAGAGATAREIREVQAGLRSLVDLVWRRLNSYPLPWLLVLDNADEPDLLAADGRVGDADGVARGSRHGLVIVTSRVSAAEVWGAQAAIHSIGSLQTEHAVQMLHDLAPDAGGDSDAAALAGRLGGLPLALHVAGRYLGSPQARLDQVATFDRYLQTVDAGPTPSGPASHQPLQAAWETSLQLLVRQGFVHARTVMRLVGAFGGGPIPASVLAGPTLFTSPVFAAGGVAAITARFRPSTRYGRLGHQQTVAALCRLGLLDVEFVAADDDPIVCLCVHPLVAEIQAGFLAAHPSLRRTIHATVVGLLSDAVSDLDPHDGTEFRRWPLLAVHVLHALATFADVPMQSFHCLLRTANTTSWGLTRSGHAYAGLSVAVASAQAATNRLRPNHPLRLDARHHMATALIELGRYREAADEFATLLPERTRVLGAQHPDTLRSRANHAVLLSMLGHNEQAQAELIAVHAIQRQVVGDTARETLLTAANIADAPTQQGHYEPAEQQLRQILAEQQDTLGDHHSNTLATQANLADLLMLQHRYTEAEYEYRKVLAATREVLGAHHPWTLRAHHGLAETLIRHHRAAEGEAELRAVLAARTTTLGPEHPDTLASRFWLADTIARHGDRAVALNELHTVLEIQQRLLDPEHPQLQLTLARIRRWSQK